MKYLILFLLLLSYIQPQAQCETKVDEFTKDVLIESKIKKVGSDKSESAYIPNCDLDMKYYKFNGYTNWVFRPEYCCCFTTSPKTPIYLLFESGDVFLLHPLETTIADFSISGRFTTWHDWITITTTKAQDSTIRANKIEKIKIHEHEYVISEKGSKAISEMISCVNNPKPPKNK